MNTETSTSPVQQDWTRSDRENWKYQTTDGYLGTAYWRATGAAMTVTRPDGTDLYRKTWSSREIFQASWPAMLEWLKGQISQRVAADRVERELAQTPPG